MRIFTQDQGIMRPALRREQIIPQIDAEIAKKGHFWMETITYLKKKIRVHGKARNGEKAEHTRSM